jgi:hypothetical protein
MAVVCAGPAARAPGGPLEPRGGPWRALGEQLGHGQLLGRTWGPVALSLQK